MSGEGGHRRVREGRVGVLLVAIILVLAAILYAVRTFGEGTLAEPTVEDGVRVVAPER